MIDIIPAIDMIDGKCVRLTQGDYAEKRIYNSDVLEVAKSFEGIGCKRLHVVDLDGAKSNHIVNYKSLEKIATKTDLIIDFGGGIKSDEDVKIAFNSGASMITGGSIAVKNEAKFLSWLSNYGSDKIILGADAKDGLIATSGWQESSKMEILPFINHFVQQGIKMVISTDINKDGMLSGPSFDLYKSILKDIPELYLVASGGVSSIDDIYLLEADNIPAVILGKAIYEKRISMKQLENLIKNQS